jgi:hypothetical protein
MLRRLTVVVMVVGMAGLQAGTPAFAARPPLAEISSIALTKTTSLPFADCGFKLRATFQGVQDKRYVARFGIHDAIYGSTLTWDHRLRIGQTSSAFKLGSGTPGGDTVDYGEVTLFHGRRAVDYEKVQTTVSCP